MKTRLILSSLAIVFILSGFIVAYQHFESNNNENYCDHVSSKFCKSNPLKTTLFETENVNDVKMEKLSQLIKDRNIGGFTFSSSNNQAWSTGVLIKDMYFANPDVPILTISVEFFSSGVITMTNPIHLIRSEFPNQSFESLEITINGNIVSYDKLSNDRISFKMNDFSEIIQIRGIH